MSLPSQNPIPKRNTELLRIPIPRSETGKRSSASETQRIFFFFNSEKKKKKTKDLLNLLKGTSMSDWISSKWNMFWIRFVQQLVCNYC